MVEVPGGSENIARTQFDEKTFLRRARAASTLRTLAISFGVVVLVLVGFYVLTEIALQYHEARIDNFYPELVRLTEPNTVALSGKRYDVRLFGRQKEYYLIRLIGEKPCPAGTVTVDFDVWGGEQTLGNYSFSIRPSHDGAGDSSLEVSASIPEGAKEYIAPLAVPRLQFYYPVGEEDRVIREFETLRSVGDDSLVEMAISFREPLTLEQVRSAVPSEVRIMWGAVWAFSDEEYRENSYLATRRIVGNPCMESREGEQEFIRALDRLSTVCGYHSQNIKRTLDFLKTNGVRYYGVVVVGQAKSVAKLASSSMVTAAVLGIVTHPN
ncbi:MAG TPA: hypothetical protein GXX40_01925 [Firmicutes bacterium]|nr:hypothetical protein [Bacillota bacterium]